MNRDNQARIADLTEAFKAEAELAAEDASKKLVLAESSAKNVSSDQMLTADLQKSAIHMRVVQELADEKSEMASRMKSYQSTLAVYQEEAGQEILAGLNINVELEAEVARLNTELQHRITPAEHKQA